MKNLNNILINDLIGWYSKIVANKDPGDIKDLLEQIKDNVENRFNEYEQKFSSSDLISIIDSEYPPNHTALVSCYKSEGNNLKLLKKAIRDCQDDDLKGLCQYCGILKPKTYDHYLPISTYPEFSALAINLIPCCKDCNGKKHNYWKEDGSRGIINFYIDNIPNFQFLHGDVVFVDDIPHVQYELKNPDNNIESTFYSIVEKHYSRLELRELYKEESTNELSEIIRIFKIYLQNVTLQSLKTNLMVDALQLQSQFGINYWRAILRITLSESDAFLNYLMEEIAE